MSVKKLRGVCIVALLGTMLVMSSGAWAQQKTLIAWGWDEATTRDIVPQIEAFEQLHPDVKIEAVNLSADDLHDKYLIATVAGTGAPDIVSEDDVHGYKYYELGTVHSLTDLIPNWREEFVPSLLYRWEYKGELMGAPYDMGPFVLFYRKDIFDEVGVDAPSTWEEYIEIGKRITIPDKRYAGAFSSVFTAASLIQSRGGEVSNRQNEILFNNPVAVEVFQYLVDLVNKYKIAEYTAIWEDAGFEKIKEGRYAALPVWFWYQSWGLKQLAYKPELKGKWRVVRCMPWRKGDPPTGAGFSMGWIWLVSKQTKYPGLAKEFAASLCTKEAHIEMAKRTGNFVTNIKALQELGKWPDPFFGGQHPYKIALEEMKDAPPLKLGGKWFIIEDVLQTAFDRMIFDKVPVEKALNDAEKQAKIELR